MSAAVPSGARRITALVLLFPSVGLMLLIERFLKAETLVKIGGLKLPCRQRLKRRPPEVVESTQPAEFRSPRAVQKVKACDQ